MCLVYAVRPSDAGPREVKRFDYSEALRCCGSGEEGLDPRAAGRLKVGEVWGTGDWGEGWGGWGGKLVGWWRRDIW